MCDLFYSLLIVIMFINLSFVYVKRYFSCLFVTLAKVLSATEQFASSLLPREYKIVSFGKWMMGTTAPMSNAELRCRVIRAEAVCNFLIFFFCICLDKFFKLFLLL